MKTFIIRVKDADDVGIKEIERYEVDAYIVSYADSPRVHGLFEGTTGTPVVDKDKASAIAKIKKQAQTISELKILLGEAAKINKDTTISEDPKAARVMEVAEMQSKKVT